MEVPVQSCNTQLVDKCEQITVPSATVQVNPRSEDKEFLLNICNIQTLPEKKCIPLPIGEVCSNKAVSRLNVLKNKQINNAFLIDNQNYKSKIQKMW